MPLPSSTGAVVATGGFCSSGSPRNARLCTCAGTRRWARALKILAEAGCEVGVFTDAPEALARVAVEQLGVGRRVVALEAGAGALERLVARLGADAVIVRSRDELLEQAAT